MKQGHFFSAGFTLKVGVSHAGALLLWFVFVHRALNGDASNGRLGIRAYGNRLAEVSKEFSLAVVDDFHFARLSRFNGCHRALRHCTPAGGDGLMNHQGLRARIGKLENGLLGFAFSECAKIMCALVKLNFSLRKGAHATQREECYEC